MASSLKYFANATSTESQSEAVAMLLRVLCILLLGVLGAEASFFNKTQAAIEEVYTPGRTTTECCTILTLALELRLRNVVSQLATFCNELQGIRMYSCLNLEHEI